MTRPRRVVRGGREYLVASMASIVPGVLAGSKGPLLYPAERVASSVNAWNQTPLVVYHPTRNGRNVSAKHPGVIEASGIGFAEASKFDGKLRHEGWFDVAFTEAYDRKLPEQVRLLPRLRRGDPIELSTGLYTANRPATGTHNGKTYTAVAEEYEPDHIAILPDQIGACSIRDGCGVNVTNTIVANSGWSPVAKLAHNAWVPVENCGGVGGTPGPCPQSTEAMKLSRGMKVGSATVASEVKENLRLKQYAEAGAIHADMAEQHGLAKEKETKQYQVALHEKAIAMHKTAARTLFKMGAPAGWKYLKTAA